MDEKPAVGRFVGIHVAKGRVHVHLRPDGTAFACGTDPDGLADLVGHLAPLPPKLVDMPTTTAAASCRSISTRLVPASRSR